jgi:hypothetical protein
MITSISVNIEYGTQNLFLAQVTQWSLNLTIFSAFIHSFNIRHNATKIFRIIGIGWFVMLQISIFFFKQIIESPTAYIFCKCLEIPRITDTPLDYYGAGIITNEGYIIYTSGYPLISTLFQLFAITSVLYSYIRLKLIIQTKRIKNIKLMMIFVWFLLLIYTLGNLPWFYVLEPDSITSLSDFCLIFALFLMAFISIRFPESLLVSHIQILKARHLFTTFKEDSKNLIEKTKTLYFYEGSFREYLNSIQTELYSTIEDEK